jgi:hypothetical protein
MQRPLQVAHLTHEMSETPPPLSAQDDLTREAAIRRALAMSPPLPRDPVRTRILQLAGSAVAVLAALEFASTMRRARPRS